MASNFPLLLRSSQRRPIWTSRWRPRRKVCRGTRDEGTQGPPWISQSIASKSDRGEASSPRPLRAQSVRPDIVEDAKASSTSFASAWHLSPLLFINNQTLALLFPGHYRASCLPNEHSCLPPPAHSQKYPTTSAARRSPRSHPHSHRKTSLPPPPSPPPPPPSPPPPPPPPPANRPPPAPSSPSGASPSRSCPSSRPHRIWRIGARSSARRWRCTAAMGGRAWRTWRSGRTGARRRPRARGGALRRAGEDARRTARAHGPLVVRLRRRCR